MSKSIVSGLFAWSSVYPRRNDSLCDTSDVLTTCCILTVMPVGLTDEWKCVCVVRRQNTALHGFQLR
jgi:hypothetical protein